MRGSRSFDFCKNTMCVVILVGIRLPRTRPSTGTLRCNTIYVFGITLVVVCLIVEPRSTLDLVLEACSD